MGKEGDKFLEDESFFSFVILRVVLIWVVFIFCFWGVYSKRKELIWFGEGEDKIFGVTDFFLKLWADHISLPDSLVLQSIITKVFNV